MRIHAHLDAAVTEASQTLDRLYGGREGDVGATAGIVFASRPSKEIKKRSRL